MENRWSVAGSRSEIGEICGSELVYHVVHFFLAFFASWRQAVLILRSFHVSFRRGGRIYEFVRTTRARLLPGPRLSP